MMANAILLKHQKENKIVRLSETNKSNMNLYLELFLEYQYNTLIEGR